MWIAPHLIQAAGKRLDRIVIALLGLALAWFAFDKFVLSPARESAVVESVRQQATSEALEQARVEAFAQSIAILPFANASGDASNDYLSNGISDELSDRLAQLPGVRVMARSSSIHLAEQNLDLADIAARFRVSRVIEGRFNRQGKQVLLSVQLIDATSGFQLWSQTYERSSQDLLLLQQDLARSVVGRMMPELSQQENPAAPSAPQVSAHDLLLLGRQYEQKVTDQQLVDEDNLRLAIDYYRQAIAADPQSAEAHARLGKMLLIRAILLQRNNPSCARWSWTLSFPRCRPPGTLLLGDPARRRRRRLSACGGIEPKQCRCIVLLCRVALGAGQSHGRL